MQEWSVDPMINVYLFALRLHSLAVSCGNVFLFFVFFKCIDDDWDDLQVTLRKNIKTLLGRVYIFPKVIYES